MATLSITTDQIIDSLIEFNDNSPELTTADVRMWCDVNDYKYQTIANRLSDYKSGRGKFNLRSTSQVTKLCASNPSWKVRECILKRLTSM